VKIHDGMSNREFEANYIAQRIREGGLTLGEIRSDIREDVARTLRSQDREDRTALRKWLASAGVGFSFQESRAAGEGTGSAGGDLVPQKWNADTIRQLREFANLLGAFEVWRSNHGEATVRPLTIPQTAGSLQTENTGIVDGPYFTLSQQSWGQAPTYGASARISNQMVQDAYNAPDNGAIGSGGFTGLSGDGGIYGTIFPASAPGVDVPASPTLDALVSSMLAESLGRVIAPVATTALYAAISAVGAASGQDGGYFALTAATAVKFATGSSTELAANTINLDTAAQMIQALDAAYLPRARFYFSSQQWAGLRRQVDANSHLEMDPAGDHTLFGYPVVISSGVTAAAASTVAGPVFGDLSKAMTLRVVDDNPAILFRSTEKYAEYMQTFFRSALRADVQARDSRAVVGVKFAAT
jgi:hypothetical protein